MTFDLRLTTILVLLLSTLLLYLRHTAHGQLLRPVVAPRLLLTMPQQQATKVPVPLAALDARPPQQPLLSPGRAWALATTAVLFERNQDRHDLLGGRDRTPENMLFVKRAILAQWWGITNRAELLDVLSTLELGGHRREFAEMGVLLASLSSTQYQDMLESTKQDEDLLHRIHVVKQHYAMLGKKSLVGWDAARYVSLARWGYLVGYLTEEEAWKSIMSKARFLQKTFQSWKDLGENYLIGREFWSLTQTKRDGLSYQEAYNRLLTDPKSPWNRYPWDLHLDELPQAPAP